MKPLLKNMAQKESVCTFTSMLRHIVYFLLHLILVLLRKKMTSALKFSRKEAPFHHVMLQIKLEFSNWNPALYLRLWDKSPTNLGQVFGNPKEMSKLMSCSFPKTRLWCSPHSSSIGKNSGFNKISSRYLSLKRPESQ